MATDQFPNTRPRLGELRVVTMNLWMQNGAWAERRTVLIDGLRTLRPDLAAENEAAEEETKARNLAFLESCVRAYLGGAKGPLMLSSGMEDYFLGTYISTAGNTTRRSRASRTWCVIRSSPPIASTKEIRSSFRAGSG